MIQLLDPVPAEEIVPRVEWLKYNEPEEHLDDLANIICNLEGLPEKPVACGITYKDDSLLRRIENKSFKNIWRIDPVKDLGISQKGVAGETIIPRLSQNLFNDLADKYDYVDVVIARHIFEHALHTHDFLSSIWNILKPGGFIVFEVPDCSKQLEFKDYSMPWEEHILYFVPETLKASFDYTSYELTQFHHYQYKIEDAQVAIVSKEQGKKSNEYKHYSSFELAENYANGFEKHRSIVYKYLKEYSSKMGKIAFYGAGHLSVILVNSLKIEGFIEFIVDDTEQKQGLYLPGTSLKIKTSESLQKEGISLCILCLSVEHEKKITQRHFEFIAGGGTFVSAFPMQNNSLINMASRKLKA